MNYELAKELKDAGFPQAARGGAFMVDGRKADIKELENLKPGDVFELEYEDGAVYLPTISELIGACLHDDAYFKLKRELDVWIAETPQGTLENYRPSSGFGSTPEEAVARLWLALNKE